MAVTDFQEQAYWVNYLSLLIDEVSMKKLTGPALLLALLMTQSVVVQSAPAPAESEQAMTEAEIKALEQDIQKTKKLLETLNKERTSTQSRIEKADREISHIQKNISELETRRREGQNEIKKIQGRQNILAAKTEQQKEQIASSLRSMYMNSSDSRLKLLLNQEDPEALSRQLTYLEYVQEAQLRAIREYEAGVFELKQLEQQQNALVLNLSREKNTLDNDRERMVKQQAERQKLLKQISSRRQRSDRELSQMEQQHEQLTELLAQIQSRQIVSSQPFNELKGALQWPVPGKVLFSYNQKRPDTRLSWPGIFIESNPGVPVRAVHDGRVIFSDWMRGYGLLTIVDHGNDYLTLYAHTEWTLKNEGEVVLAGEPLALSGQSGGQLSPGLYFEIRRNGNPENPASWLKR